MRLEGGNDDRIKGGPPGLGLRIEKAPRSRNLERASKLKEGFGYWSDGGVAMRGDSREKTGRQSGRGQGGREGALVEGPGGQPNLDGAGRRQAGVECRRSNVWSHFHGRCAAAGTLRWIYFQGRYSAGARRGLEGWDVSCGTKRLLSGETTYSAG